MKFLNPCKKRLNNICRPELLYNRRCTFFYKYRSYPGRNAGVFLCPIFFPSFRSLRFTFVAYKQFYMKQFFLLSFVFIGTVAFAQKSKEESATEKFVLKLHETKFRWMVQQKLDSLNSILDDRIQYVHSNGWVQTKKEISDDLRSGKLTMKKVTVTEATARVYKGFVIVNGKGIFNVLVEGKPVDINLLYTEVYAKRANGWLLVSRHANKLGQ